MNSVFHESLDQMLPQAKDPKCEKGKFDKIMMEKIEDIQREYRRQKKQQR